MQSVLTKSACGCAAQQAQADERVLLDVDSLAALKRAVPTVQTLEPGDRGQVVLTGPGLGIAADTSGAEVAWRRILGPEGIAVQDVHGEGLNTAIVEWFIPESVAASQGLSCPIKAEARSPVLSIVLVGAIVAVVLFLGWMVLGRVQVLLFGKDSDTGIFSSWPALIALGVAAVVLIGSGSKRRT